VSTPNTDISRLVNSPRLPRTPLGFGDVFGEAFKVVGRTWLPMLLLTLLQTVAVFVVGGILLVAVALPLFGSMVRGEAPGFGTAALLGLGAMLYYVAVFAIAARFSAAMVAVVGIDLEGGEASVSAAMQRTKGVLGRMVTGILIIAGAVLVLGVIMAVVFGGLVAAAVNGTTPAEDTIVSAVLGLLAFYVVALVAAIVLQVKLYFTWQSLALEGETLIGAWKSSWRLTNGSFWRVLGYSILFGLVVGIPLQLLLGMLFSALGAFGDPAAIDAMSGGVTGVLLNVLVMVLSFLVGVLVIAFSTVFYVDLLRRRGAVGATASYESYGWGSGAVQPYGSTPYGSGQYGGTQYGSSPYGEIQQGGAQYGGSPYGESQYGSSQPGGSEYGNAQFGAGQYGSGQFGSGQSGGSGYAGGQFGTTPYGQPTASEPTQSFGSASEPWSSQPGAAGGSATSWDDPSRGNDAWRDDARGRDDQQR